MKKYSALVFVLLSVSLAAQEVHFSSDSQILSIPLAVLDGATYYEDVEILLDESTGKFSIIGGAQVPMPEGPYQIKLNFNASRKLIFGNDATFFDVLGNDSRCPDSVECIQAGEVTVQMRVNNDSGVITVFNLTLSGSGILETPGLLVDDTYFRLLEVIPYPVIGELVSESDYELVLEYSLQPF